jgi:hypothetical protein
VRLRVAVEGTEGTVRVDSVSELTVGALMVLMLCAGVWIGYVIGGHGRHQ